MGRRLDRVCVLLLGQGGLGGGRLRVLGVEHRFRRGGQARQALDLAGYDDLGGLAVGGGGERLHGFILSQKTPSVRTAV